MKMGCIVVMLEKPRKVSVHICVRCGCFCRHKIAKALYTSNISINGLACVCSEKKYILDIFQKYKISLRNFFFLENV